MRLQDVRVHFSARKGLFGATTVRAVDGVSLTLDRGETVALVGESGSGKTTLGRASLRLIEPAGGAIVFDGKDITHVKDGSLAWFRRQAQAIFQDPYSSINGYMSVYQIVEEPLAIHHIGSRSDRAARVEQALEAMRLRPASDFVAKYPHQLSGGQRQRVAIARTMVMRPHYLVADEPVSMVDASSRVEILHLLREHQAEDHSAVLYITHDIATAHHFARRIGVMYLGSLVEIAAATDVIDRPLHPYTQLLIEAVPEPDPANRLRQRQVVPGEPPTPASAPGGCTFHPRCPKAIAGVCNVVRPALQEAEPGRFVACHLYGVPVAQAGAATKATA